MKDPILKLKLLAKTEMTLGKHQARRTATQVILTAVALLFVVLGIGMLNFAGYQSFAVKFSPALAALFVALIDIIIGMIVLKLSSKAGRTNSDEEEMVKEIRDLVYTELNTDVDALKAEFAKVSDDVYRIRSGFSAITSGKAGGFLSIIPLIELLTKTMRKKK